MKTKIFFVLILLAYSLIGCKNSQQKDKIESEKRAVEIKKEFSEALNKTGENSLKGTWYLIQSKGGFAGINESIPHGEIKWTFDIENQILAVENNFKNSSSAYTVVKSGNYDYSVVQKDGNSYLFVTKLELGKFHIENGSLIINENKMLNGSAADRFVIQFER